MKLKDVLNKLKSIGTVIRELVENGYFEGKYERNKFNLVARLYLSGDMINYIVVPESSTDAELNTTDFSSFDSTDVTAVISNLEHKIATLNFALNLLLGLILLVTTALSFGMSFSILPVDDILTKFNLIPSLEKLSAANFILLVQGGVGTLISLVFYWFRKLLLKILSKLVFRVFKQ